MAQNWTPTAFGYCWAFRNLSGCCWLRVSLGLIKTWCGILVLIASFLPPSLSPLNPPPLFPGTPNKATCAEIWGLTFSAVSLLIAMQWENGRGGKKRKASLSFPYVTSFCYFSSFTPSFFPHLYLPLCWRFLFTCSPLCNSVGAARLRTFAPHGRDAFFIHPWPQLLRFTDRQYRT